MRGPDSILDPVAHRLRYTESYPSTRLQHSSAQLGVARLTGDDVADGSHYANVPAD
jgi:hypothetical protein